MIKFFVFLLLFLFFIFREIFQFQNDEEINK